MALTLPTNFQNDVQGKDTNLVPVIRIGTYGGSFGGTFEPSDYIFISTSQIHATHGDYYTPNILPLLLNIPSVKESINIKDRKYKISNISLNLSNAPYNGKRFSDRIAKQTVHSKSLINVECRIYWVSPSALALYSWDDPNNTLHSTHPDAVDIGALMIFNGIIRRYNHDANSVKITVEDKTQALLDKNLPFENEDLTESSNVPNKYLGKLTPMVFGKVDKSPLVSDTMYQSFKADSDPSVTYRDSTNQYNQGESPLYIVKGESIVNAIGWQLEYQNYDNYNSSSLSEYIKFKGLSEGINPDGTSPDGTSFFLRCTDRGNVSIALSDEIDTHGNLDLTTEDFVVLGSVSDINNYGESYDENFIKIINSFTHAGTNPGNSEILFLKMRIGFSPAFEHHGSISLKGLAINNKNLVNLINTVGSNNVWDHGGTLAYEGFGNYIIDYTTLTSTLGGNPNIFPSVGFEGTSEAISGISDWYDIHRSLYNYYSDDTDYPSNFSAAQLDGSLSYGKMDEIFKFSGSDGFNFTFNSTTDSSGDLNFYTNLTNNDNIVFTDLFRFVLFYFGNVANGELIIDLRGIYHTLATEISLDVNFNLEGYLNNIGVLRQYRVYDIFNEDHEFYAHVFGRNIDINNNGWALNNNNNRKFNNLARYLISFLGYTGKVNTDNIDTNVEYWDDWFNDFTIDKRISAKKLLEGLSSSTPYIIRFNALNEFTINQIPLDGGTPTTTIDEEDVIDFSFSRTIIDDLVTKVDLKYKWSYVLGEFEKTFSISTDQLFQSNYFPSEYGLKEAYLEDMQSGGGTSLVPTGYVDHIDTTLVVDSGASNYIRDDASARRLAYFLLSLNCNQHLKINIKLPLKYLNLEPADIINFNAILGDIKPYGIDYLSNTTLNGGQVAYPNFIIDSTKKTLEFVEIECTQLHSLYVTYCDSFLNCAGICCDPIDGNWHPLCADLGSGNPDGIDECGVCGGSGDTCGECWQSDPNNPCGQVDTGCSPIPEGECDCFGSVEDCFGVCGGSAEVDECGICGGPGDIYECGCTEIPETDCDCNGNQLDECGLCGESSLNCDQCHELPEGLPCGEFPDNCFDWGICGNCTQEDNIYNCPDPGEATFYSDSYHFPLDIYKVSVFGYNMLPHEGDSDLFISEQLHMFNGYDINMIPMKTLEDENHNIVQLQIPFNELTDMGYSINGNPVHGYYLQTGESLKLDWKIPNVEETPNLSAGGQAGNLFVRNIQVQRQTTTQYPSDAINSVIYDVYPSGQWTDYDGTYSHSTESGLTSIDLMPDGELFFKLAFTEDFIESLINPTRTEYEDQAFTMRFMLEYKVEADFPIAEDNLNYWFIVNGEDGFTFKRILDIPILITVPQGDGDGGTDPEDAECSDLGQIECPNGLCVDSQEDCIVPGNGDVNDDGSTDVLDIVQMVNHILGDSITGEAFERGDMNGDGMIDVLDIVQVVNHILD